jgi:hypothetical protein
MTDQTTSLITARDDDFHFDEMSDRWWMTETVWFSFCKPEIGLGGWVYNMFRPNIGTVAGGCWIWDATAHVPWEVPYSANYTAMPLQKDGNLNDISLRNGVTLKTLEPLKKYQIGYKDEDRLDLNLVFDAVMEPRQMKKNDGSFQKLTHFDQYGHVTGTIVLHGETIDIDCHAIRDRSWGPRPEHRPGRSAYVSGIASPNCSFLAVTKWNDPTYPITNGFAVLDGTIANLVSGQRRVTRDDATGCIDTIILEAKDDLGRDLHAVGKRLSGIIINRHSFVDSNSLIEWTINGQTGHGEDQDMWPVYAWSEMRRKARAETKR